MSYVRYSVLVPIAPWEQVTSLCNCLVSLCHQELLPSQIVLSFDGLLTSTMSETIQQFVVENPSIVFTTVEASRSGRLPTGVGPTLQRGLHACDHDLVMRLDVDDVAKPERSYQQIEFMTANPEVAVLGSYLLETDEHGNQLSIRSVPLCLVDIRRVSYWRNPMNHPTIMFRRSAIISVGGYVDCPGFEDYHLWLRLLRQQRVLINQASTLTVASAGGPLIARRYGLAYAIKELSFLLRCASERLLPISQVMVLIVLRLPTRIMPRAFLAHIMHRFLRRSV